MLFTDDGTDEGAMVDVGCSTLPAKLETGSIAPSEFVGLRSKLYSLLANSTSKPNLRAKGIKRSYIKKHLAHQNFLHVLNSTETKDADFQCFRSRNHTLNTVKIHKTCLTAYDDKRYIKPDGVTTLTFGNCRIADS